MKRLPDWPKRLHDFIDGVKRTPFDWATHNCGQHWAAGGVEAVTGQDVFAPWRGRFSTRLGAIRVMKNDGFASLADWAAAALPEIHVSRARPGDIAAIPDESAFGCTLGIVNGETVLVLREDGMGIVPLFSAKRAFQVG